MTGALTGMSRFTGKSLSGIEHLRQSIADILTTPIGSRVCLREYGSGLFELVDQPLNGLTVQRVFAAVALALSRWEPRLKLTKVSASRAAGSTALVIDLYGYRTDTPAANPLSISIPIALS
jgi:uncharacterized protein